jgi:hypothetical protein
MTNPPHTLEYIVMLNCHEESRLAELLADYRQSYPQTEHQTARTALARRLSELIRSGKVGMYELPLDRRVSSPSEYRDLGVEEAVAIVQDASKWDWEAGNGENVFYLLFAQDEAFWGDDAAG